MLPILILLLLLAVLIVVPAIGKLRNPGMDQPQVSGVRRWSALATSVLAFITALLAVVAVLASIASPILASNGAGVGLLTGLVLGIPGLAVAVLMGLAGMLMRALRVGDARTSGWLVAGLAAVAIPIAGLATVLTGFAAADFGGGGTASYAAIVAAANVNFAAVIGSALVLLGGLVNFGLAALRRNRQTVAGNR